MESLMMTLLQTFCGVSGF